VPVTQAQSNFDDEEDVGVAESWEAAGDSEDEDQSKEPTRKRVPMHLKIAEREQKEQLQREKVALAAREEDAAVRKARLQRAEVDADLNNAVSLLGAVDIHPRAQAASEGSTPKVAEPGKLSDLSLFQPTTKQDFDNLRKTVVPLLTSLNEKHGLLFPNFAIEFARDLCKPLSSDQTRKVASTVNAIVNEKQREERANRGKKAKPLIKQASAKIDDSRDTTNYDDFEDDDFM
jgi:translation initiation factor 3 subunit J